MTLSIVVITMNRAEQLCSALLSCVNSILPERTEFIIIDNASTDNTEEAVKDFFVVHPYPFVYEKELVNKGVGGGRNRGFELAKGEIVYFLDDDAVVAPESYDSFFIAPMSSFHSDPLIASITTRIYDELLERDRDVMLSKSNVGTSLPEIFMYLGGSHFLRKQYFEQPLYLDFKYGMEELLPSIYAIDNGFKNCYYHNALVFHQPRRNKWESGSNERDGIVADYNVNNYVSKKLIYPVFYVPVLYLSFWGRTLRGFGCNFRMWKESISKLKERRPILSKEAKKVRTATVRAILKNYSFGAAF